jgi:meiotic recombination protein SPO11
MPSQYDRERYKNRKRVATRSLHHEEPKMDEGVTNHGEFLSMNDFVARISTDRLCIQVKTKQKAEIQALSSFGFQYITEVYLPRKLKEGDWI